MSKHSTVVELRGVSKSFGSVQALNALNLKVAEGELVTLLGPSGCGKTTLLRIVAGLERPDTGAVLISGRDVTGMPTQGRGIGFAFQSYALFPHLTVRENIQFGLRVRGTDARETDLRVDELLDLVQLPQLGSRMPTELSGGQAQRVALARALAPKPSVLLLDEPLSALDQSVRVEMQEELRRLQRELGATFVCVTHDQGEALTMSDRIVLMGRGTIAQEAAPAEMYSRPRSLFAAKFIGDTNAWPVSITSVNERTKIATARLESGLEVRARMADDFERGVPGVYVLRPEFVAIGEAPASGATGVISVPIVVRDTMVRGESTIVVAELPEGAGSIRVRVPTGDQQLHRPGAEITCSWSVDDAVLFRPDPKADQVANLEMPEPSQTNRSSSPT